jgi:hypothetical protein
MTSDPKPVTAESVREAVQRGDYVQALDLWNRYAAGLASGGLTAESFAEAAALIAWCRPLLLGVREHAAARLRALHVAGIYGAPKPQRTGLIRASL